MVTGATQVMLDQQTMDILVERVAAELREHLDSLVSELLVPTSTGDHLTVAQVAERLGVARSTVYAHWREWGGFKLSDGDKAPIRFPNGELLTGKADRRQPRQSNERRSTIPTRRRRRRAALISDAPRMGATGVDPT